MTLLACLIAAVMATAPAAGAGGQKLSEPPPAEEAEPFLAEPPRALELAPADIPAGTPFPTPEVAVVLELDIDEQGSIVAVRVVEGAGEPFDAAAVDAIGRSRFSPGKLSTGEPVPVTITFRMRIAEPPPPPPPPVRFEGRLLERGTRTPLVDVEVTAAADGQELARAVTGPDGRFAFEVGAPVFALSAAPPGHDRLEASVEAAPGEERSETFYLEEAATGFTTVVRAERVRREVTRQVIPKDVVAKVAGTQGDTLKAVQNLPGAARDSFGGGALILRGSSPGDSRTFLDGHEIPVLYHFGGLRSTFNSAFLEQVEFVPGNFGPDRGRAIGGIVDVLVRDPASDLFRGEVDLNLYDAGFALEGPLGRGWSIGGAFHRSWIDSILPFFLPDDAPVSFSSLPRYYDYQLIAAWKPDPSRRLRLTWFGSLDKIGIEFERPASDPVIRDAINARIMFHNLQASWWQKLSPALEQETSLQVGFSEITTEIGPELFFDLAVAGLSARTGWTWQPVPWATLRAGLDLKVDRATIDLQTPFRPLEGENPVPVSTREVVSLSQTEWIGEPALFLSALFRPFERVTVEPSLRIDWYSGIESFTFDPRLSVGLRPLERTAFRAGIGLYQQPPSPDQYDGTLGNPDLVPVRSLHLSGGIEQRLLDGLSIELTGFHKWIDRLVIRNGARAADPAAPPYLSEGTGRIYGLELLVRAEFPELFTGWLAYTLQRSLRTDGGGASERPFDFDQPHNLTVLGTFTLGRGWSAGFRFRLVSGNPETPVVGSVYDAGSDTWVPLFGKNNAERLALFHQLDLRVDKMWTFETWRLSLYLDVQNVYNQGNQEGWSYSYDYREREKSTGLPVLPILGIKGEW